MQHVALALPLTRSSRQGGADSGSDEWRARLPGERRLLLGGWVPPVLLFYNKLLVAWFLDVEDYHTLAILADFGFLSFLGAAALVTLLSRAYAVAPFIIEAGCFHLALEMVFDAFVGRHASEGHSLMSGDILMHHVAAITGFLCCIIADSPRLYLGCVKLVLTEVTVALPVAFHQGRKRKNVHGNRAAVIGALMPAAFIARTAWVFNTVQHEFYRRPHLLLSNPTLLAGSMAGTVLWMLNAFWAAKCLAGAKRVYDKIQRQKEGSTKAMSGDAVAAKPVRTVTAYPASAGGVKVRDTLAAWTTGINQASRTRVAC